MNDRAKKQKHAQARVSAAVPNTNTTKSETTMRHARRAAIGALLGSALLLGASLTAHADDSKITLGFSQVGAESAWRTANTVSVKSAAKDAGINLKFSDAQQKQENQIKAIRSYIGQKGDEIAFSPVVKWGPQRRNCGTN